MIGFSDFRGRLIATAILTLGSALVACTEEPGTEGSLSPACTVNCDAGGGTTGGLLVIDSGATLGGTGGISGLAGGPGGADASAPAAGGTGGTGGGGGNVPCAVQTVVQQRCGTCHGATPAGSPMSLVTYANWHAQGTTDKTKQYWELAKARINSTTNPMPPAAGPTGMLTAAELTTLNNWLNAGAQPSSESCQAPVTPGGTGGTDPSTMDTTGLECFKMLAHADGNKAAKYKVGSAVDRYINFGFQAPWQGTLYGLVVRPVIDNSQALHHWLLYREPIADGSITETIGQHGSGELIHGWAPGGIAMDFRKHGDVGFELPATTYSIEVHYNSSDPNAQDASGVELCGKRTKPQNLAAMSWLGYDQGGTVSYATGICLEPSTSWTGTCRPSTDQPIHLIFMTPHLHQTGRYLKAVINGPNGSRVLHDKAFDFAYQVTYETNEVLMPGESITTSCTFSEPKCAGQKTTQEMCYLFTYAWPAGALVDNGPEGSFMHGDGVCLGQ